MFQGDFKLKIINLRRFSVKVYDVKVNGGGGVFGRMNHLGVNFNSKCLSYSFENFSVRNEYGIGLQIHSNDAELWKIFKKLVLDIANGKKVGRSYYVLKFF